MDSDPSILILIILLGVSFSDLLKPKRSLYLIAIIMIFLTELLITFRSTSNDEFIVDISNTELYLFASGQLKYHDSIKEKYNDKCFLEIYPCTYKFDRPFVLSRLSKLYVNIQINKENKLEVDKVFKKLQFPYKLSDLKIDTTYNTNKGHSIFISQPVFGSQILIIGMDKQ